MDFSERLKEVRNARGLTQQQMADMLDITKGAYSGYETGRRQPDVDRIKKIANVLNTSGDYLLDTGFSGQKEKTSMSGMPLTKQEIEHIKKHRNLTFESQVTVLNLIVHLHEIEHKQKEELENNEGSNIIDFYLSEQPASAGTGIYLNEESMYTVQVKASAIPRNPCFGVRVSGDSMLPRYNDGDVLIVSKEPVNIGEIGVFTMDGEGYVKKLGKAELISLNDDYSPIPMDESILCNGKVIGVLSPKDIVD